MDSIETYLIETYLINVLEGLLFTDFSNVSSDILILPYEIVKNIIMIENDVHTLIELSKCNSSLNKLFGDDDIWKQLYVTYFGSSDMMTTIIFKSHYELFKICYSLNKLRSKFGFNKSLKDLYSIDKINININRKENDGSQTNTQKIISLLNNKIKIFPNEINLLSNLYSLTINNQEIKYVPALELTKLEFLNLNFNEIKQLDIKLPYSINLRKLELSNNKIEIISSNISNLVNLKLLDMSNNYINSIPNEFNRLTNLEIIRLSHNKIKDVPICINTLPKLIVLSLSNNQISSFKFDNLTNLICLNLSCNKIEDISADIRYLIKLEDLSLKNNNIKIIPSELSKLTLLEYFSISGNPILEVPPQLNDLPRLSVT